MLPQLHALEVSQPTLLMSSLPRAGKTNGSNVVAKRLKAQTTVTGIVPGPVTSSGGTSTGGASGPTTGAPDPQPVPSSIQVLGENACLPGTDFYGNCPAAQ